MVAFKHQVQGVWVPDDISGHQALELLNTRAAWGSEHPHEYLVSYDAFGVWAYDKGLLSAAELAGVRRWARRPTRAASAVLEQVQQLREAYYAVVTRPVADPADLERVRSAAAAAYAVSTLRPAVDGRVLPDGGDVTSAGPALPLHRAALAAAQLLADGDGQHVRACGGTGCGWVFLDRTHRRRWCIMAICGNRAKARAYAARGRTPEPTTA